MKLLRTLIAGVLTCAAVWTNAGQSIYQQQCMSCHGADGAGNPALKAPNISGMNQAYLQRQIGNYQQGKRGAHPQDSSGAMMKAIAASLTAEAAESVSAYIASLPRVEIYETKEFAGFRARGLFSGCGSCHGVAGEGYPNLGAPRISEQYDWYLKAQLESFRKGWRGNHPEDERGQQMRVMAEAITSESDIDTLVRYIVGLGVQ